MDEKSAFNTINTHRNKITMNSIEAITVIALSKIPMLRFDVRYAKLYNCF